MGETEATQEYLPHGVDGKTEILRDVVTHPKSQSCPVPKQVSNLVQSFGRKTHLETLTWWGPQDEGSNVGKWPLREEVNPHEINKSGQCTFSQGNTKAR